MSSSTVSVRWPGALRSHVLLACAIAPCFACSVLIENTPKQCVADTDCSARGGAFSNSSCVSGFCEEAKDASASSEVRCTKSTQCGPDEVCSDRECKDRWACLNDPSTAPTGVGSEALPSSITLDIPVASVFGMPLPGVKAKLCRNLDPECETPEAELESDSSSTLHVELVPGTVGYYVEVAEPNYFPQLYFLPSPLTRSATLPNMVLTPPDVLAGLGMAVGAGLDPERGQVLVNPTSCEGAAPGIALSATRSDDSTIAFYILDGVPTADLQATTESGGGGFLNFPPGNAAIKLTSVATERDLRTLSIIVRPGYISNVFFNPTLK